jgi:hypothetical protein
MVSIWINIWRSLMPCWEGERRIRVLAILIVIVKKSSNKKEDKPLIRIHLKNIQSSISQIMRTYFVTFNKTLIIPNYLD